MIYVLVCCFHKNNSDSAPLVVTSCHPIQPSQGVRPGVFKKAKDFSNSSFLEDCDRCKEKHKENLGKKTISVLNFVLENASTLLVCDKLCAVVTHCEKNITLLDGGKTFFFYSGVAIFDLKRCPGFEQGEVKLREDDFVRYQEDTEEVVAIHSLERCVKFLLYLV